jgi:CO/xanthine dehydrogenase FAD-binding subunit
MGTLGGNLATASPAGDGSTALLCLDAEIEILTAKSKRRVPVDKFFLEYRKTALEADELIGTIRIPVERRTAWEKVGKRGAMNISIVAAAASLTSEADVRIALASVAPTPIRCYRAEEFIRRRGLSREIIREAASIARSETSPIDDHRASAEYKSYLSEVLTRRLLERLATS